MIIFFCEQHLPGNLYLVMLAQTPFKIVAVYIPSSIYLFRKKNLT